MDRSASFHPNPVPLPAGMPVTVASAVPRVWLGTSSLMLKKYA